MQVQEPSHQPQAEAAVQAAQSPCASQGSVVTQSAAW